MLIHIVTTQGFTSTITSPLRLTFYRSLSNPLICHDCPDSEPCFSVYPYLRVSSCAVASLLEPPRPLAIRVQVRMSLSPHFAGAQCYSCCCSLEPFVVQLHRAPVPTVLLPLA